MIPGAPPAYAEATAAAVDALRREARYGGDVDIRLASELTLDALSDLVASIGADLVVIESTARGSLPLAAQLRKRSPVAVLYVPQVAARTKPGGSLLCVGLSARERWAIAAFLKMHTDAGDRAVLLASASLSPGDLRQMRDVAGLRLEAQTANAEESLRELLARGGGFEPDLIVLPRLPPPFLLPRHRGRPVLILPSRGSTGTERERSLDVPDLLDDGRSIRVRAEYAVGVGRRTAIVDQTLAFVGGGRVVARSFSRDGTCELPSGLGDSLGVFRSHDQGGPEATSSIETRVSVLRASSRPRLPFDVELDVAGLRALRRVTWADPVGVRVRSTRSFRSLRARLRRARLPPIVIDAGTVLDEGDAHDVSPILDAVRLARTAARMRACGFQVPAIVYRGSHRPSTVGFAALQPQELSTFLPPDAGGWPGAPVASPLDATTGSEAIAGNRIEVELDNPTARTWLLRAIESSEHRVHFQVYMALDDDVGRPVEAALAAAAARGVTVRVLVDSLHGLHGSFGLHNAILDRLASRPGVELRVGNPITGESSLEDLKRRDHRKLVVVDGGVALLGGRNLSHEYYAGFGEVPVDSDMTWRMVPWLDAGARVEGPAVAALDRAFLQAWTDAGGAGFDIAPCPQAGTAAARVIVHRGLRDAHTVDAYLALIDGARSHVSVVNGFPLMLEIQHALLRALKRGVRVRTLVGNLTPRHGLEPFAGPWATARTMATSFVHSRMDPIVAAGGECYEFLVPRQSAWHPSVGDIRPHVHAKVMSVDGRVCAVGSANLDVTAGYWESELLLVVEDETIATAVEARFDELFATSLRVDPEDPDWKHRAELRRWMRYWPGVLSA